MSTVYKLDDVELLAKLKENVIRHIRPYNLGDTGETESLVLELIRRYEATHQSSVRVEDTSLPGTSGWNVLNSRLDTNSFQNNKG